MVLQIMLEIVVGFVASYAISTVVPGYAFVFDLVGAASSYFALRSKSYGYIVGWIVSMILLAPSGILGPLDFIVFLGVLTLLAQCLGI